MSIDRYDPIRVLGEGSFGKVYLMRDKVKRNFVCVKIIKIKNIPKKEREATKLEVDLLKRLNHPNIVGYVDSFLSKNQESLCICMEYCDGGDLASQIKAAKRNLFSESKILHWFVQLALGLHYMHGNRILHRDLKTQNVFLLGNGRLVLGDLGISKVLDGTMDFAQTCIGTPYYMSPEIFKNKPYSYKSDIWALGCILYELTTLNHAFDANSLNGLATKIVKGKYPPISNKYSKHLRDLITQMLMLNPQQRPDVDQILRKPFIKKHIVNFFVDIYSRPSTSIGEGTMILKAAAGGSSGGSGASVMNDQSMINFRNQLQQLDMMDMVQEALRPKEKPQDDQEAIRQAKEQASALKREQEHKKMVEAALEKLRQERELRARQRGAAPVGASGVPGGRVAAGGAGSNGSVAAAAAAAGGRGAAAGRVNPSPSNANAPPSSNRLSNRDAKDTPSPANNNVNNNNNNNNNNVRDRGFNWDQRPIRGGAAGGGANEYLPPPRYDDVSSGGVAANGGGRRRSTFEDQNKPVAAAVSERERERDRVERDRRAAEERRRLLLIQEQETQAAAAAKQRVEDQRRREEAKAASDAALARARAEAEAERQRLDAAREKAEQATRARRDAQREKERERQRLEIEQLKKDKLELDRRTQERDKMREDRRVQEVARMDAVRREQMDVMQEKLDFMNNQLNKLEIPSRRALAGGAGGGAGYVPSMAEEKSSSDLSARERAYFRRGENKLGAKEEYETADNNNNNGNYSGYNNNNGEENAIGRRSRLAAQQQQQQQQMKESSSNVSMGSNNSNNSNSNSNNSNYVGRNRSQFSSDPAPQVLPGEFSPPPANNHRAANYEYDANAQRSSRRLRDLSSDDTPASSSSSNNNNNNNNYKMGGGGLLAGHGSDSDEDDLFVAKKNALMPGNADDEEEDLVRREEELRAELNFATMRCEELKRTLQETKSFLGPRLPTRGKVAGGGGPLGSAVGGVRPMAPPASAAALGMGVAGGIAAVNGNEEEDDMDDDDEDDFLTEDEYDDDFEEGANNNGGRNNNNNNRGPKSSFSIQTDFDDDDNGSSNNNNPDRTLPRLRPPVSAVPSSAYGGLQDMPSPSGKLSDRIERLRQRCKEALGERTFWEAYNFLKQHEQESQGYDNGRDLNDDDYEARKMARVRAILGERKEHYVSLIDQLIFMEDAEHD